MPNELVKSVVEARSMAFVGAGISRPVRRSNGVPLPDWPSLLNEMLDYAERENVPLSGLENELREAISSGQLLIAAQELQDQIDAAGLAALMRDVFLDEAILPTELHQKIVEIPFAGVLTTNYDTLIEGAYTVKSGGRIPPVYTQEDLEKVPNPLRSKGAYVFKLHGDINRPDTIVLSSHDYQDAMFRRPGYRSFLETAFTVNTFLLHVARI